MKHRVKKFLLMLIQPVEIGKTWMIQVKQQVCVSTPMEAYSQVVNASNDGMIYLLWIFLSGWK